METRNWPAERLAALSDGELLTLKQYADEYQTQLAAGWGEEVNLFDCAHLPMGEDWSAIEAEVKRRGLT